MTTVYVAMINDRHAEPEPELFTTAEAAIDHARTWAQEHAHYDDDFEEPAIPEEWLYYATYSPESDAVWVVAKDLDAEAIIRTAITAALRDMADLIDRGPTFPLPPSVISALVRERADNLAAEELSR